MSWPPSDSTEARELREREADALPFDVPPAEESKAKIRDLFARLHQPGNDDDDPEAA